MLTIYWINIWFRPYASSESDAMEDDEGYDGDGEEDVGEKDAEEVDFLKEEMEDEDE